MKHFSVKEEYEISIVVDALLGNIKTEIIPEAMAYLRASGKKNMTIQGLQDVTIQVNRYMTNDEAFKCFELVRDAMDKAYGINYEAYKRSDEYQAEQARKKAEEEERQAGLYPTVDKAIEALKEIKPIDLKSEKTSMKEAKEWAVKVLKVMQGCEDLRFDEGQRKLMSDTLRSLGAVSLEELRNKVVNKKLVNMDEKKPLLESNDLSFPLSAMGQLIDTSAETFSYGLGKMTEGGLKYSWIGDWFRSQENAESETEEENN